MMKKITRGYFTGERALYHTDNLEICDSLFENGESPIKECHDIDLIRCEFKYKYPIWYSNNINVYDSKFDIMSRSGLWYAKDVLFNNVLIDAPKLFRRCENIVLKNATFNDASETLWNTKNIKIMDSQASGDYFLFNSKDIIVNDSKLSGNYIGLNCENIDFKNVQVDGNYCFDGASNILIDNCVFNSKDSFWNTKNVTIRNAKIVGEYLGWNSQDLTLIDCEIESNQGLCYINNIRMINCKLINTDLCFELCENVDANILSDVISIKNPKSGIIKARKIGKLILDKDLIDLELVEVRSNEI